MHPAEVAASMDAPSKFAQRTNRGFADTTCNLVTAVMLPLEPNRYSNGTEGARTVPFGNSPSEPYCIRSLRKPAKTIGSPYFVGLPPALARLWRGQSYEYFMWVGPVRGAFRTRSVLLAGTHHHVVAAFHIHSACAGSTELGEKLRK